jgi:hypothetical protein
MLADIDAKDESLSEAKDLTKIKGTISSVVSANKDAIFAAGDEIAMGKKTIDVLNKAITDKALTAGEEGHAKLWIKKLQDSIARNKKSAIAGSITTLATGTVIQKQDESIDKPDASATVTEDKKEEEKPTMDKKTLKAKLLDVTSGSDEFTDEAINAVDNIIDEAEDGQDLSDLVPDEVDRACIYYKDCWKYLEEANITEWEEAFKEGYGDLVGVTTYFLQNEIYELLGEIQK